MLRTTTSRSIPRAFERAIASKSSSVASTSASFHSLGSRRPNVVTHSKRLTVTHLLRYATKPGAPQFDKIDQQAETELRGKKLEVDPEGVTATSSVSTVVQGAPHEDQSGTDEVSGGVKADLVSSQCGTFLTLYRAYLTATQKTIKETFALNEVPRDAFYLGAAGTLPYLATSLSTVLLSYNINHAPVTGTNWMFTPEQAHYLLSIIQPIQIGYGAVVRLSPFHPKNKTVLPANQLSDPLVPGSHSLGPRVCRLWRPPLLPPLRHRRCCPCHRLANYLHAPRIRPDLAIRGLHGAIFRRRQSHGSWVGSTVVFDL